MTRTQGRHWSISDERMAAVLGRAGADLTRAELIELALDADWTESDHQDWLDTAEVSEIAAWAIALAAEVRGERA